MPRESISPTDLGPLDECPPKRFDTERLQLIAVQPGESELVFRLYASDPVATRYMSFSCTGRLIDTQNYVEEVAKHFAGQFATIRAFMWIIYLKATGEPIGSAGLEVKNKFALQGGYILNQKFWGKGYATEAWRCLVDWAKSQPGVYRIEAVHDADNPKSGKVLQKSGLQLEGILKRAAIHPNVSEEPRDAVMYAWGRPYAKT